MGSFPPQPITIINIFNKKYVQCDPYNTEIEDSTDYCILHNIGQEGFISFCKLLLPGIQYLCLSKNNISNINFFINFKAPSLVKLDLSYNIIKKIDILGKVSYPLKNLDLSNNKIDDINVFKKESILKNLQFLLLKNNNIDFNDENNKKILSKINERIKKNIKQDSLDSDESKNSDESIIEIYKAIKTINDKFKCDLNIFDKNLINRIKKLQVDKNLLQKIEELKTKLKESYTISPTIERVKPIFTKTKTYH